MNREARPEKTKLNTMPKRDDSNTSINFQKQEDPSNLQRQPAPLLPESKEKDSSDQIDETSPEDINISSLEADPTSRLLALIIDTPKYLSEFGDADELYRPLPQGPDESEQDMYATASDLVSKLDQWQEWMEFPEPSYHEDPLDEKSNTPDSYLHNPRCKLDRPHSFTRDMILFIVLVASFPYLLIGFRKLSSTNSGKSFAASHRYAFYKVGSQKTPFSNVKNVPRPGEQNKYFSGSLNARSSNTVQTHYFDDASLSGRLESASYFSLDLMQTTSSVELPTSIKHPSILHQGPPKPRAKKTQRAPLASGKASLANARTRSHKASRIKGHPERQNQPRRIRQPRKAPRRPKRIKFEIDLSSLEKLP